MEGERLMHGDDLNYKKGDPWNDPEYLPLGGLIFMVVCLVGGILLACFGGN
jgi:hypothetical protein